MTTLAEFEGLTVTTAMLASALGLSRKGIAEHTAAGRLKRVAHGEFLLAELLRLYTAHLRTVASGRGGAVADERERLARIRADRAQMMFDLERGKLGDAAAINKGWRESVATLSREIMKIPWVLASTLSYIKRYEAVLLEREIRRCLSNIGQRRPPGEDGPGTDFDPVVEDSLMRREGSLSPDGQRIVAEARARRAS
jgi:terminase small subunit / prophage DNA-packing protein